ncbi:MAG: transposase [Candidatus Hadarchaeales archaeon]
MERAYPRPSAQDLVEVLTCLDFLSGHQSTNMLERLFRKVKGRTEVPGVFPNERSLTNLVTGVMLRVTAVHLG